MDSDDGDFAEVRKVFDADTGIPLNLKKNIPSSWPQDKIERFVKFYAKSLEDEQMASMVQEANLPRLSATQATEILKKTDFTSSDSVEKLLDTHQPPGFQRHPMPILLGTMEDYLYLLQCERKFYTLYESQGDIPDQHRRFVEFQSSRQPGQPLQDTVIRYGMLLGTLSFVRKTNLQNMGPAAVLMPTPFDVWLDVVSRTIWLIFDPAYNYDMDDDEKIDIKDVWEHIPTGDPYGDNTGYDTIQTLKLDDVKSTNIYDSASLRGLSDSEQPLFKKDQLRYSLKLQPYTVSEGEIIAAIKTKRTSVPPVDPAGRREA